ncbi:LysR family transcriptional regulator [Pseudooceanicola sediminis]|uniref:LysR family transcriptional regulator n=1 Tax=Pseudooceanicola sediminis TaxID=2211117 RepID=A0A399J006_9RHOB|nr:LysR family transcriptional regulator [Pseudooceanicola sediminis]KAA2313574.1 LysR family transcriptional regulator [Puniceibacterium sp. HSS470]RII38580.1 LysR family transcriptional regulator [Pseudooceanicola sediminis]|tara:strand:+ start:24568 stop:25455 length:888 start_codon:yes stop_codon:yes gene_type:complete
MDNWDEIRTAYQVARLGTVSGAADVLGVHHATVIRHIDALERRMGVKLFQRHTRGYTATEAGQDLLRVAQATDDQFSQLSARIKGRGNEVSGELVVTTIGGLSQLMVPLLAEFQEQYPDVALSYLTSARLFRLEYGEAHVAIRAGSPPQQPDNVVQPFLRLRSAIYGSKAYIERHGMPKIPGRMAGHRFVGIDDPSSKAPFAQWMRETIPAHQVVFRSGDMRAVRQAVLAGVGLGFLGTYECDARDDLIEVHPPLEEWDSRLWLVTHMDLHRTTKVQAFLNFLKDHTADFKDGTA